MASSIKPGDIDKNGRLLESKSQLTASDYSSQLKQTNIHQTQLMFNACKGESEKKLRVEHKPSSIPKRR